MVPLSNALEFLKEEMSKCNNSPLKMVKRFLEIFKNDEISSEDMYPTLSVYSQNEMRDNQEVYVIYFSIRFVEHTNLEDDAIDLATSSTTLSLKICAQNRIPSATIDLISFQKSHTDMDDYHLENLDNILYRVEELSKQYQLTYGGYEVQLSK